MHTRIQTGTKLLAAALRDPAPIIDFSTFWDFMRVVEACGSQLTNAEKAGDTCSYKQHIACSHLIDQLHNDVTLGDNGQVLFGSQIIEAFAAYAEQAAGMLTFLFEHRPVSQITPLLQDLEQVMQSVVAAVSEVPHMEDVDFALHLFCDAISASTSLANETARFVWK